MGINDRDYAREETQGFNLGGIHWTGVGIVIALNVAIFLVDMMTTTQYDGPGYDSPIQNLAALTGNLFREPWKAWQLLTYGWLHSQDSMMHIVFNMLGLWFFGRYAENVLGKTRFLQFYVSSLAIAGLVWAATQFLNAPPEMNHRIPRCVGASGGVMAMIVFAAWLTPNLTVYIYGILPMPLWLLAVLYFIMDISGYAHGHDRSGDSGPLVANAAHLGGALAGTLFYHTRWCLADLLPNRLFGRINQSMKIRKRGFKVHQPSDDDDEVDAPAAQSMSARVDAILEKMSRVGEEGLTKEERDYLADASRKLRARRGK